MQKKDLKNIIVLGLSTGILMAAQNPKHSPSSIEKTEMADPEKGNMNYYLMSEQDLLLQLDPDGIKAYKNLDEEGKKLARQIASNRCNGTNPCAGYNACQTDKNDCAGKGSCKGQGKCAFSDKNLAVKIVAKKMAEKRQGLNKNSR